MQPHTYWSCLPQQTIALFFILVLKKNLFYDKIFLELLTISVLRIQLLDNFLVENAKITNGSCLVIIFKWFSGKDYSKHLNEFLSSLARMYF